MTAVTSDQDLNAPDRLRAAVAARHGDRVAASVLGLLEDLELRVRNAPSADRRSARDRVRRLTDEGYREERRRHRHASTGRAQHASIPTAGRRGMPWTGPELEIAARDDLTSTQVAAMTGRTLYGVQVARRKLTVDPRAINLAGVRRTAGPTG